jgi:ubiquinone/menaquinone biosynthesis C-methylase UbiE
LPQPDELKHGRRFDLEARNYDLRADAHPLREQIRRQVVETVIELAPTAVLDLGCGTGESVLQLAPHVKFAAGLDVSYKMLQVARRKAAQRDVCNVRFDFGSFQDADFRAAVEGEGLSLDCILATYSLHHLEGLQQRSTLRSMCGAVEPRGSIVIGDLMFFEDPSNWRDDFERVGYNPANDRPQPVEQLVDWLRSEGQDVTVRRVHPLAGMLIAKSLG